MRVKFVAGFGPIVRDLETSKRFYKDALGIPLVAGPEEYLHTDELEGVKAFALWRLEDAAESTFGAKRRRSSSPPATGCW